MIRVEQQGTWAAGYTSSRRVARRWRVLGCLVLYRRQTREWVTCVEHLSSNDKRTQ